MFLRLFLLFTIVPAVELYLIIKVGAAIGAGNTILLIIGTGILGAYYARQQGLRVFTNIQWKMEQGQIPGDDLVNGAMLLVGGALLITPGFITDFAGFSLIFPPTREAFKVAVKRWLEKRVRSGQIRVHRY
ncbi:MAG: membrane protein FxsA [bacterium]|nr:MAG: membrane protein FxsA [bacterium]